MQVVEGEDVDFVDEVSTYCDAARVGHGLGAYCRAYFALLCF